jgi:hypothetical protein
LESIGINGGLGLRNLELIAEVSAVQIETDLTNEMLRVSSICMSWPSYLPGWAPSNFTTIPDCRNGGQHRFGIPRFLKSRNVVLRACRFCQAEKITQYDVADGKLIETKLKVPKKLSND